MIGSTLKAPHTQARPETTSNALAPEFAVAVVVWLGASLGLLFQVHAVIISLALLLVPVVATAALGRAVRTTIVAVAATLLCVGIFATGASESPNVAILVMGLVNLGAIIGANSADHLRESQVGPAEKSRWNVEVTIAYPAESN